MQVHARVEAIIEEPLAAVAASGGIDDGVLKRVVRALDDAARPLVLCGPAALQQAVVPGELRAFAERAKLVIASEASGQARFGASADVVVGAFDTIWRTARGSSALSPDFVLQLGANPTSKGWEDICNAHRIRRVVVHPWDWVDPCLECRADRPGTDR